MTKPDEQVRGATLEDAARNLITSKDRVWDEAPDLYWVYQEGDSWRFSRSGLGDFRHNCATPYDFLHTIAMVLENGGISDLLAMAGATPGDALVGMAFRDEAWMVAIEYDQPGSKAAIKHAEALAAERQLSTHADRREQRFVWVGFPDGTHTMTWIDRLTGDVTHLDAESTAKHTGGVPDGIVEVARAVDAMKAPGLHKRPRPFLN